MEIDTTLHTLYIASDAGDTDPVVQFLDNVGLGYRVVMVSPDNLTVSGEPAPSFATSDQLPVLVWDDEYRVSNCSLQDLVDFLHERGVELEDS